MIFWEWQVFGKRLLDRHEVLPKVIMEILDKIYFLIKISIFNIC